jgi:S-disulfanyl-L-cysteine oxidoreductase SoxD
MSKIRVATMLSIKTIVSVATYLGISVSGHPVRTVGSYWPYATTVWDYIHRTMPYARPGTLTPNQTYAVTAFILYLNGILDKDAEMNETTLPRVKMPNRDGFVRDPRPDVP